MATKSRAVDGGWARASRAQPAPGPAPGDWRFWVKGKPVAGRRRIHSAEGERAIGGALQDGYECPTYRAMDGPFACGCRGSRRSESSARAPGCGRGGVRM